MNNSKIVELQSRSLNLRFRIFGRSEIKELKNLLRAGEKVLHCAYGFYQGGTGLLVATEQRVLLIDKRPFYLNVEEMKYDSLRYVDVILKSLQASLQLRDGRKKLIFRSISDARLKGMKEYIADKITIPNKEQITSVLLSDTAKPYLNPAWRPRHTIILPRPRPQKFYGPTSLSQ
jgi:hypothetical protein